MGRLGYCAFLIILIKSRLKYYMEILHLQEQEWSVDLVKLEGQLTVVEDAVED